MNDSFASIPASETIEPDEFFDHESAPLKLGSQKIKKKTDGWNVFGDPLPKASSASETNHQRMKSLVKIIKNITSLVLFIAILSNSVSAKLGILFMTSQLRDERTITICNQLIGSEGTFIVTLSKEERITWLWMIMFSFGVPEIKLLLNGLIGLCKSAEKPKIHHFMLVMVTQTFHIVGLAIMLIHILPELNVVQGAMLTNGVCFVPGLLGLLSRNRNRNETKQAVLVLVDLIALAAQATAFVAWPLLDSSSRSLWLNPIALFLVSCGWWENYVSIHSPFSVIRSLGSIKEELRPTKPFLNLCTSIWKMITFLCSTVVILHLKGNNAMHLFTMFGTAFSDHNITAYEIQSIVDEGTSPNRTAVLPEGITAIITTDSKVPMSTFQAQIANSSLAYLLGILACKFMIQGFSFALPVNLTMPVTISLLIAACALREKDPCVFHGIVPDYLFYESPTASNLSDFIFREYAWVWLLWLLSQMWITLHIWTPKCEHLASIADLFISPVDTGLLVDQSMALNRRRDDQSEATTEADDPATPLSTIKTKDRTTKIFACATMWHETRGEMLVFLRSILKMDLDQCARKIVQDILKIVDPNYYEFETHIFFDDAFESRDHDYCDSQVNRYVKCFIDVLDDAASEIHHTWMHIQAPKKYPTPYGGRLVWTLPGNTKMIVHLKDNSKIRHRKRWSQVMYMYYLLGHRIMDSPMSISRKEIMSQNTYLLTLDGDVNFEPSAVNRLVNLMKKDAKVGAVCGRIHPVGHGPMVWYQTFEYAIGHWLTKVTEHMIGCVVWSPACFSLLRAKALMDDGVMKRFTASSYTAREYVQREYGDDQWLSILLLQKGYKINYSYDSHGFIHTPQNFQEFFYQRRRWIPSSIANVLDLITNWKITVQNNKSISRLYIGYLVLVMGTTILVPGMVFLVLIQCFVSAFDFTLWTSFCLNIIPVSLFIVICYTCKSSTQFHVAAVMSKIYMLVMMIVLTSFFLITAENGWLSPGSLIVFSVIGLVAIAGFMHPQELIGLLGGFIFYFTIPSTYLLLVIHSVINLNGSIWGTRKARGKKTFTQLLEDKKVPSRDPWNGNKRVQTSIEFSSTLFSCAVYNHGQTSDTEQQLMPVADSTNHMMNRLDPTERLPCHLIQDSSQSAANDTESSASSIEDHELDTHGVSPHWLGDDDLKGLEVDFLSRHEERFWKGLINEYLTPVEKDNTEQIADSLKELRNDSAFAFFMLNALLVITTFWMQLNKDTLSIRWPLGSTIANVSYSPNSSEVSVTTKYLLLEPISLVFAIVCIPILSIRFLAMLIHRLGVFFDVLARTNFRDKEPEGLANDSTLQSQDAIAIVKELQCLEDDDNDNNCTDLNEIFRARFFSDEGLGLSENLPAGISREAFVAFEARRTIVIEGRKNSEVETEGNIQISIGEGDENDNQGARNLKFEMEERVNQTLNQNLNSTESSNV